MTKIFRPIVFFFTACFALSLFSGTLVAQGTSSVKVTKIGIPWNTTFNKGELVRGFWLKLHNLSSEPYGCSGMTAELSVFENRPFTLENRIWHATRSVEPFAKQEVKIVFFYDAYFIVNVTKFSGLYFQAKGPVCPPHEFPDQSDLVIRENHLKLPPTIEIIGTVCITSHKYAPINRNRDLHVWVTNNHFENLENIAVSFYVEGKGTTKETIPVLQVGQTKKITRNHSWPTRGTRKLSATVTVAGKGKSGIWTVEGIHRVVLLGEAVGPPGPHVKCSDGTTRTESEMK